MIVRESKALVESIFEPSAEVSREAAELGRRVRRARRRLGHDREKRSRVCANVSSRTVFAIEKGKPTVRFDMLAHVITAVGLRLSVEQRDAVWRPPANGK